MQFSGPPINISNPCSAPLNSGNTTRVHAFHALLLPSLLLNNA